MSRISWGVVVVGVALAPAAWADHHEESKMGEKAEPAGTEATQPGASGQARTAEEAGSVRGSAGAESPSTPAPGVATTESGKAEGLGRTHPESSAVLKKLYTQSVLDAETAKLASERSQDAETKRFADALAQDHKRVGEKLEELGKGRGVDLSKDTALSSGQKAHVEEMKRMSAPEFEAHFKEMMVQDHGKLLNDIQAALDEANRSGDRELAAVLQDVRPTIEEHHAAAKTFGQAGSVGSTGTTEPTQPDPGSYGTGQADEPHPKHEGGHMEPPKGEQR
jgi:putative membrane protein